MSRELDLRLLWPVSLPHGVSAPDTPTTRVAILVTICGMVLGSVLDWDVVGRRRYLGEGVAEEG